MFSYLPEGCRTGQPENTAALSSLASLETALQQGTILEARAMVCDFAHNLIVDLGHTKGIIPHAEGAVGINEGTTRDIAIISRVNKPVCFKVIDFLCEGGQVRPVLSRRAAQQECLDHYIASLVPGQVIPARVTHLEPFGCFVDVGCGLPSLIPIDAISISRISHPADRFSIGQDIKAVVRGVDSSLRISLSHKELLGTWEQNAALFCPGETVAGVVRSTMEYGVFVELTPNLAGLAEPCAGIQVGQQASVYIKSLIPEKMKVKLIIVDAFDAQYSPQPPQYYIETGIIERWQYSPDNADRLIESLFQ